jgi:hypothetical protein
VKLLGWSSLAAVALVPAPAFAADSGSSFFTQAMQLDVVHGPAQALYAQTSHVALGLLGVLFGVAMVVEFLRVGATGSLGSVILKPLWAGLIVVALLRGYPYLAGTVLQSSQGITQQIVKPEVYSRFSEQLQAKLERYKAQDQAFLGDGITANPNASMTGALAHQLGGQLFGTALTLVISLGLASFAVFKILSATILGFLYVMGPLALAASVLAPSVGMRWFRTFVTIALWPLIAGILLQLTIAITQVWLTSDDASILGILAMALMTVCITFTTPALASAFLGGSVGNVISTGASAAAGAVRAVPGGLQTAKAAFAGGGFAGAAMAGGAYLARSVKAASERAELRRSGHGQVISNPPISPGRSRS